jgi:antitoxin component YwqK of YwqJK toxin-antitoxin module
MIPRFLIRNIKCCEFLLIHKAKKAVSISEKECPAGNRNSSKPNLEVGKRIERKVHWLRTGALQSSGFYINGKLEGKKEDFFPSGQISSIIYSKNNKFYNIYRTYFDTTIHESSFSHLLSENTNQDSLDLIYKKIQIRHEWVYNVNGEILIKREYFRNGKLKEEETFLEDINFRILTTYQENGNILTIGYKKDGKSYGHYQWFDKNGLPEQGWDYDDFGNVINKKD